MGRGRPISVASALVLSVAAVAASSAAAAEEPLTKRLAGFFDKHCVTCHDAANAKGGLDLAAAKSDLSDRETLALWVRLYDRVARGEMPPKRKVPAEEKTAFLAALSADLTRADAAAKGTVLRRLNRAQYENTLHDLLGIRTELAELLPEDGRAHGFDTVGEALDISAAQLQRYMDAAGRAIDAAVRKGPRPEKRTLTTGFGEGRGAGNIGTHWLKRPDGALVFYTEGGFPAIQLDAFRAPVEGRYRFRLTGYAHQSAGPVTFSAVIGSFGRSPDSRVVAYPELPPGPPTTVEIEARLHRADTLRIHPQGLNPGAALKQKGLEGFDGPGLAVLSVQVEGPLIDEWPGRGHKLLFGDLPVEGAGATPGAAGGAAGKAGKRAAPAGASGVIVSANPEADAERLLKGFVPAAFRRPVGPDKIAPYLALAKAELAEGAVFEQAMRTAYIAVLCSPDFLFLVEPAGKLDDHALASRLSYFLWNSGPDAALLAAAASGELSTPAGLKAQAERLLADPRSARFVSDFTAQWLNLREIDFTVPDRKLYPEFDDMLKDAMVRETELFFAEVLRGNLPVTEFLHSDWTMLNERLARHYRIEGVKGPAFRKVALKPEHGRGGLLTQASVLKVSANGTNTSPVVRGVWVLERVLGDHPPPPPPGIPGVEPDIRGASTLRELLDKHRSLPSCVGCHKAIDPHGFALEVFDVIGGRRDRYRIVPPAGKKGVETVTAVGNGREVRVPVGPKVDASGELPDGRTFTGPEDYKRLLLADPDRFAAALTGKLAVYACGRGMGFSDRPAVAEIVAGNAAAGRGFRDLVHRLVQSPLFRTK
jgi:mono/diheme cytochrome c family protein